MTPEALSRFAPRNALVFCTYCTSSHRWTGPDAWTAADPPGPAEPPRVDAGPILA